MLEHKDANVHLYTIITDGAPLTERFGHGVADLCYIFLLDHAKWRRADLLYTYGHFRLAETMLGLAHCRAICLPVPRVEFCHDERTTCVTYVLA